MQPSTVQPSRGVPSDTLKARSSPLAARESLGSLVSVGSYSASTDGALSSDGRGFAGGGDAGSAGLWDDCAPGDRKVSPPDLGLLNMGLDCNLLREGMGKGEAHAAEVDGASVFCGTRFSWS